MCLHSDTFTYSFIINYCFFPLSEVLQIAFCFVWNKCNKVLLSEYYDYIKGDVGFYFSVSEMVLALNIEYLAEILILFNDSHLDLA